MTTKREFNKLNTLHKDIETRDDWMLVALADRESMQFTRESRSIDHQCYPATSRTWLSDRCEWCPTTKRKYVSTFLRIWPKPLGFWLLFSPRSTITFQIPWWHQVSYEIAKQKNVPNTAFRRNLHQTSIRWSERSLKTYNDGENNFLGSGHFIVRDLQA